MPKMKTKSGAKKRFKMTGTGKVKAAGPGQAPRHDQAHGQVRAQGARHHGAERQRRQIVKKYMPYAR